jgi:hypothetical protein
VIGLRQRSRRGGTRLLVRSRWRFWMARRKMAGTSASVKARWETWRYGGKQETFSNSGRRVLDHEIWAFSEDINGATCSRISPSY